jgi:hypothetical protein
MWVQSWKQDADDGIGLDVGADLRDPAEAAKVADGFAKLSQDELNLYVAAAETPMP